MSRVASKVVSRVRRLGFWRVLERCTPKVWMLNLLEKLQVFLQKTIKAKKIKYCITYEAASSNWKLLRFCYLFVEILGAIGQKALIKTPVTVEIYSLLISLLLPLLYAELVYVLMNFARRLEYMIIWLE